MLSAVEKLQKFIRLEVERGYDNRAVVGGLDKILPSWEAEARANHLDEGLIQTVIEGLRAYPDLEPPAREDKLSQLIAVLSQNRPVNGSEKQNTRIETEHAVTVSDLSEQDPPPQARPVSPPSSSRGHTNRRDANRGEQPPTNQGLSAPLNVLQGIGNRYSQALNGLGLETLEDLLFYFPRRYDDYSQLKPINRLVFGEETTVLGTVQSIHTRPIRGGKIQMTEAVVGDGTGFLRVSWFNQPWLGTKFVQGSQVVLAGKVEQYLGRLSMTNPEIEQVEQDHLHTNRIVPVYSLTANVTQKLLRRIIYQTVSYWASRIPDYLPNSVRKAVKLVDLSTALLNVHFPETQDMLDVARWRLAFDEIFLLQLGVQRLKRTWQVQTAQVYQASQEWLDNQIARLPYQLTGAQQRVLDEIRADLASGHPMERLIQGDVGSGKTVVAALAISIVTQQDGQAALMAPTSILAEQHYRSLSQLLSESSDQGGPALRPEEIRLLIGDTPESEKVEIRSGLEDGSVKLIIGTHALLESPVNFKRLQLAIIDEQHRFGVSQRSVLRAKGENPHLLVMTATPIPRSLALTVYGDLDLSVMDEMPPGRQPVETFVLRPVERERAYTIVESQVQAGYQAFIIYPLVEQGENGDTLAAVEEHQRLQSKIFPRMKLGLLHGRMKPEEKEEVMRRFRDREYNILVSTTVVEVGVDVPNATVMLIEGANRFGLAQLHQLRGRVGRGSASSFCLLIPDNEDAVENERLAVMSETNDGFVLAERDLQQRGPGDFLGTRQAGFTELRMASLTDVRLIEKAREQAQILFKNDPELTAPEHKLLVDKLEQFWGGGRGDIS
jgi:ATP-dependent DNA helicase RecG